MTALGAAIDPREGKVALQHRGRIKMIWVVSEDIQLADANGTMTLGGAHVLARKEREYTQHVRVARTPSARTRHLMQCHVSRFQGALDKRGSV